MSSTAEWPILAAVEYVEQDGIWHLVNNKGERVVETLCERVIVDATILERDEEPKPLCWRCRERLTGP